MGIPLGVIFCFSLAAFNICSLCLIFVNAESFPRQVDKESRGLQGERGLEFSRRKKGQIFFSFSTFRLRTVSGLNLLANSVILKCKLWE